jgi:hypothetical protein
MSKFRHQHIWMIYLLLTVAGCGPAPATIATPPDVGTPSVTPSVEWIEATPEWGTPEPTTTPQTEFPFPVPEETSTPYPITLCTPYEHSDSLTVSGWLVADAIVYRGDAPAQHVNGETFILTAEHFIDIPIRLPAENGRCYLVDEVNIWIDCALLVCAPTPTPIGTPSTPAATPLGD